MKRKKKLKVSALIGIILFVLVVSSAVGLYFTTAKLQETRQSLADVQYELDSNTVTVYTATRDIKAGEKVYAAEDVNIEKTQKVNSLTEDFFMTEGMRGMQMLMDVKADTPIMAGMVSTTEISSDLREYDYVDVRILFPDGSDYLVGVEKVNGEQITRLNQLNTSLTDLTNQFNALKLLYEGTNEKFEKFLNNGAEYVKRWDPDTKTLYLEPYDNSGSTL